MKWLSLWLGFLLCLAQAPPNWQDADHKTVRLRPSAFPELPPALAAELAQRGCTIPQVPEIAGRHNVIRGHFLHADQIDWAALCSVNGTSSILVFRNGSPANPLSVEPRKDIDALQGWGGDRIIYSRQIAPVNKAYIMEHYNAYGGPKPPPIDHEGINDVFVGKASVVLYRYKQNWLHLSGAD
jgi:hypothetical protein